MGRGAGFGAVDRLPSGRYRARYVGPDGRRRTKVFGNSKAEARAWLAAQQTALIRKGWRAPEAGLRTVGEYAQDYLARSDLRESTKALYASLWRHHLAETWGRLRVDEVNPAAVRSPAAALVYQHASDDRDAEIARALDAMLDGD